jgi:hypothetical protein
MSSPSPEESIIKCIINKFMVEFEKLAKGTPLNAQSKT